MQSASSGSRTFRFGTFELDVHAGELRNQGVRIRLQDQPLRILEMLLERPGQVVNREELRARLWPSNSFVDFDHGLNKAINKLREALGDSAENPRYIETLARRGYRFLGELKGAPQSIRSLLVLPLESLPHDPKQDYFAEGLTEALTTSLAKISALRVISRTTAAYYKRVQKPLPEIARELGIDAVVEGSVLRAEGRVRISAQLIHAPTDTHLWAESYDRDLRDVLALQAEVASAIAKEIQVKVTPQERTQLAQAPAVNPEAYDAYLRGRYHWSRRTPDDYRKATLYFEQAIDRDPRLAAAYAGLADCFSSQGWFGILSPDQGCGKGKQLALHALELDPNAAEAHTSLAWAVQHYDYDFVTAEKEYRRAIELDPRYLVAHYWFSLSLAYMGRFNDAIAEARRGIDLDPLSPSANVLLDLAYWFSRQYEKQIAHVRKTIEIHPNLPQNRTILAWGYLETSNYEAAIAEMRLAAEYSGNASLYLGLLAETCAVAGNRYDAQKILGQLLDPSLGQYVTPYIIGRVYAALDQTGDALHWLETAYRQRAPWMSFLNVDPRLDRLRSDRRFEDLLRRMNIPSGASKQATRTPSGL